MKTPRATRKRISKTDHPRVIEKLPREFGYDYLHSNYHNNPCDMTFVLLDRGC